MSEGKRGGGGVEVEFFFFFLQLNRIGCASLLKKSQDDGAPLSAPLHPFLALSFRRQARKRRARALRTKEKK